jgi:heat shock 70kDa protein 1/2/6/8
LKDAQIDKSLIHEIVVVGGSTRLPMMRKIISELFDGKQPNMSVNCDEAACHGAAIQAANLSGDTSSRVINKMILLDVAPISIGIETGDGFVTPLLTRNTTIPAKKSETISTTYDYQRSLRVSLYEGEQTRAADNNLLGELELGGITPGPGGPPQIDVTLDIDANSVISVEVHEKGMNNRQKLWLFNHMGREEIDRKAKEIAKYKADDEAEARRISTKNEVESAAYKLRDILEKPGAVDQEKIEAQKAQIDDILNWLYENEFATRGDYVDRLNELENIASLLKADLLTK